MPDTAFSVLLVEELQNDNRRLRDEASEWRRRAKAAEENLEVAHMSIKMFQKIINSEGKKR